MNNSKSSEVRLSKAFCRLIKILATLFGLFTALEGFGGGIPKFIQKAKEGNFNFAEMGILIGIGLTVVGVAVAYWRTRRGAALMIVGGFISGASLLINETTRTILLPVIFSLPFILFGLVLLFCGRPTKNRGSTRQDNPQLF